MGAEDEDRREMLFLFYLFIIVDSKHLEEIFKSARWQSYELDYSKKERTMETFPRKWQWQQEKRECNRAVG